MNHALALTLLGSLTSGIACIGDPTSGGSQQADDGELRACVIDVWYSGVSLACHCTEAAPHPECDAADCREQGFLWLRADGVAVEGSFFSSAALATFSSRGPLRVSSYVVEDGALIVEPERRDGASLTCDRERFVWGLALWTRFPAGESEAFEAASPAADAWLGEPFPPE